ncbi:AIS_HP2_G0016910.mRNA.1.CDS.1 [Saccharomyces cerevisiae]|nr:AIS_HP2_G0016910.mRNA.1.CDS.1 [Saccharomyces cerevisiae]CAI6494401.1 AIS_HP2_G0016910.mRNA.1.CDS.1 [Saccharomyces cerevisiae]
MSREEAHNRVELDDVGVQLDEDDEEDLLEYNDEVAEEQSSDANIRNVAETLMKKKLPKVTVEYEDTTFLLFASEDEGEINNPIICENTALYQRPMGEFMESIRQFMGSRYGSLAFATKELVLRLRSLDLTLFEDNVYNNHISFNDVYTIFKILKERSESDFETDIPTHLAIELTTRPRFVSRYNALVELTESSATLKNIKPFSNDETHPLILDDNDQPVHQNTSEVIVMDIDDDGEGGPEDQDSPV